MLINYLLNQRILFKILSLTTSIKGPATTDCATHFLFPCLATLQIDVRIIISSQSNLFSPFVFSDLSGASFLVVNEDSVSVVFADAGGGLLLALSGGGFASF